MKILIDMQGAQSNSRYRGIGRYSTALTKAIIRNRGDHEIFLLLNALFNENVEQIRREFASLVPHDHILTFAAPSPVCSIDHASAWRKAAAELIREWTINQIAPDVLLVTSLFEGATDNTVTSIGGLETATKVAVILYDLIPLIEPESHLLSPEAEEWYRSKIDHLCRADLLLPISESARKDATDFLGFDPDRMVTIYPAADARFATASLTPLETATLMDRLGICRPFIMHASVFDERKNFEGLVRAFALLPASLRCEYQLVLVASHGRPNAHDVLHEVASRVGLGKDELVVLGHVSDADLVALYSLCTLFVFPSLHEGFGLPPLEAMCCGAAVIGSNTTSIPEVIGREDALFDPASDRSIADVMERALSDRAFRDTLKTHSRERVRIFNWDRSAALALRALETAAGVHTRPRKLDTSQLINRISGIDVGVLPSRDDLITTSRSIAQNEKLLQALEGSPVSNIEVSCRDVWLPSDSPRILLLKLDHIGDFIITFDAFRLIRKTWPKAHITLVCGPWNKSIAERSGYFDEVLCCEFYPDITTAYVKQDGLDRRLGAYRALKLGAYDLAVDLRYYDDNRMLLAHTDAKYRAGYVAAGVPLDLALPMQREPRPKTESAPEPETRSNIGARITALAAAVTWTFGMPEGSARAGLLNGRALRRFFDSGITVGIAPGTGNTIKAWGRKRFADLVHLLHVAGDYRFVLIGGDGDCEDARFICERLPTQDVIDLTGALDIADLPPVIAGLDLFVGNDTGTTHMAAMMEVPTVCVFSGAIPFESWRPVGVHLVTLRKKLDCSPCQRANIEDCHMNHECMDISPSIVAREAIALHERSVARTEVTGSKPDVVVSIRPRR